MNFRHTRGSDRRAGGCLGSRYRSAQHPEGLISQTLASVETNARSFDPDSAEKRSESIRHGDAARSICRRALRRNSGTRRFMSAAISGSRSSGRIWRSRCAWNVFPTMPGIKSSRLRTKRQQSQQVDQARKPETERLNAEAKRGDKKAQQQPRQLEQQQKKETRAQGLIKRATRGQNPTATAGRTSRQLGKAPV